jgi:predicted RNA-binding protein
LCEFKVMFGKEVVFDDAVYAKVEGNEVIVKDILGDYKKFENCRITEVDVNKVKLVLSPTKISR